MELRDYLRVVRRRWPSIVLIAVLAAGAALAYTATQAREYASTARLFVSTTSDTDDSQLLQGGQFSAQRVKSYADLVTSRELASRVVADARLDVDPGELSSRVSAAVVLDTVNLTVTVRDADPHRAQRVAQSYAEQLTDLVRELETPSGATESPIKATIVDAASLPEAPISPRPTRNVGLGVLIGLLLGLAIAVLREVVDTRVRSTEDLAGVVEAPTLGTIGNEPGAPLVTDVPSHSPRAEAFRVLRTNLQFVDVDAQQKVFVVTSSVPAEGKTTTAVNLAISLALGGVRTLLIECDLRRPKAAARMGMDEAVGVTTVLLGRVDFQAAIQRHGPSGLEVLTAGPIPPNPAELLQSKAMADLLGKARAEYDVVLMDAPPLLPVADASLLASKADGALLVVRHGRSTKDQLRHSVERLDQVGGRVVGLVMNMVPSTSRGGGTYGYGYGYAPAAPDAERS